jgi:oligosaccharide repeat unit polymerase
MTWVVGLAALAIAIATLYAGRRDVTRPAVAFGVVWFGCVALAQLRLTLLETPWPTGFAVLVFAGGLLFMLAAALAGGTAAARLTVVVSRERYSVRRAIVAGAVLAAGGIAGTAYKAHVLGGLPLLSGNADELRAHAFKGGEVAVPAWSSALTDGFFLAMWCFLLALWLLWGRAPRWKPAAVGLCAAACLFGVALLASRNTVLLAVAVPLIALYLLFLPRRRIARGGAAIAAAGVVALVVGGLFVFRLAQGEGRDAFLNREMDRRPPVVRPLIPFYVSAVYPFEAASRLYQAVPHQEPYTLGGASLTSLPDAFFPEGKPPIGTDIAVLMRTPWVASQPTWSVAGYQGRLFADAGWAGVLLGSALLGLAFGSLYRWARAGRGVLALAVIAYVAYYSAFMVYDNLLSFTVIAVYDLAVVAAVDRWARGALRNPFASRFPRRSEAPQATTG